jgi:DNA-binding response OmpR family regulator
MKKILIIEDDSYLREMYKIVFSNHGFVVEDEGNENKALKLVKNKTYDVILLDLLFPSGDGLELIKVIRSKDSLNKDASVVVITNLDQGEKTKKALSLGADKCLFKVGHTPKSVMEEVVTLLDSKDND